MSSSSGHQRVAVVIPCYKVGRSLPGVVAKIGPEVERIYTVIDACPEDSLETAQQLAAKDERVVILVHEVNKGVGGAIVTGYRESLKDDFDITVKIDGDGQMDPAYLPTLIKPIVEGDADYAKGSRFFFLDNLNSMPPVRLLGNSVLSLVTKFSSGYWKSLDPTNGFTAIEKNALKLLPLDTLHERYFFETDMLCRLGIIQAVVAEVPMPSIYADEESHLSVFKTGATFPWLLFHRFLLRLFYNYFLRNFTIASINLVLGSILFVWGVTFGALQWIQSLQGGVVATAGTVMLAALPIILGMQFILHFLSFDMQNMPIRPIQSFVYADWQKRDEIEG